MTEAYNKNKPLINSIIAGLIYFLFSWSVDFNEGIKGLFMALMLFLPGLTFPLTTTYYNLTKDNNEQPKIIIHLILSVIIYHIAVWIFSGEGRLKYITLIAGLFGSFLYLVITKLILKKNFSFGQIVLTAIVSGLSFLPYELIGRELFLLGIAILLWTVINGLTINLEYKKNTTANNVL
jgi:hypothetical protein